MEHPKLAIYGFGFNLQKIVYPWVASLRSALELVGQEGAVFFCECYSEDDTFQILLNTFGEEIATDRLVVMRHPWEGDYHIQAIIGNKLLDEIGHNFDYALKLDMDEVLCEWSFPDFYQDLHWMEGLGYSLGKPRYTHFCPDDRTVFPFIYASKAVISSTRNDFRFDLGHGGDACALGGGREYQARLQIYHYGKMQMGRRREAVEKEFSFQQKYTALGFPDPIVVAQREQQGYIDYEKVFRGALGRGEFKPYSGQHPKFVQGWLEEMRQREQDFAHRR